MENFVQTRLKETVRDKHSREQHIMSSSTVQDRKPPSAGTKVDPGKQAPVTQESAGPIPSESLAAESQREGGEFASNKSIGSENTSVSTSTASAPKTGGSAARTSRAENTTAGSDTTPSYVTSHYHKDSKRSHGKNLEATEDFGQGSEDGIQKAFAAEPGSENDPSRLAEQRMQMNQTSKGRDAGPRQAALATETAFDALDSETAS